MLIMQFTGLVHKTRNASFFLMHMQYREGHAKHREILPKRLIAYSTQLLRFGQLAALIELLSFKTRHTYVSKDISVRDFL